MLRIDHLVVNIDKKYQTDELEIQSIRNTGLPYEPKWGKGTKGFKASNIWIGNEYLEMINLLKKDGGGWKPEWVEEYNKGHRGLICLMLDVVDVDKIYEEMVNIYSIIFQSLSIFNLNGDLDCLQEQCLGEIAIFHFSREFLYRLDYNR